MGGCVRSLRVLIIALLPAAFPYTCLGATGLSRSFGRLTQLTAVDRAGAPGLQSRARNWGSRDQPPRRDLGPIQGVCDFGRG